MVKSKPSLNSFADTPELIAEITAGAPGALGVTFMVRFAELLLMPSLADKLMVWLPALLALACKRSIALLT